MALREIRLLGDPVLRKDAQEVTEFDERLRQLVEDMIETMQQANGVGLAAPQVGVQERIIVVETPEDEEEPGSGQLYVLVNPEIVYSSEELVEGVEGCLSIPGYVGEVIRSEVVTVKGQDPQGRNRRVKSRGFLARAFQHEIDHLSGELFIDKLTAPERIWRVEEGQEEQAELEEKRVELVPAEKPVERLAS
jgi:peptide deformylase